MEDKTKTWQEEKIKHTAEHIGIISEGALKTLVSELRKRDMEALLEINGYAEYETRNEKIKEYYVKN